MAMVPHQEGVWLREFRDGGVFVHLARVVLALVLKAWVWKVLSKKP